MMTIADHAAWVTGREYERARVLQLIASERKYWTTQFSQFVNMSSNEARDRTIGCEWAIAALDELRKKIEDNG